MRAMIVARALALFALSAAQPAIAGEIWTIAPSGVGSDFACPQQAVNQAVDGDTLLIQPADYVCAQVTIDGKSLNLVVDGGGHATFPNGIHIRNLAANQPVTVSGIHSRFLVENCAGDVLLHKVSKFEVAGNVIGDLRVLHSAQVTLVDSHFQGLEPIPWSGEDGKDGITVVASQLTLYRTTSVGSDGAQQFCHYGLPGNGGHGLVAESGSLVRAVDCALEGGAGGVNGACGDGGSGLSALAFGGSTFEASTHPSLQVTGPTVVREGQSIQLEIEGAAGERARYLASGDLHQRFLPTEVGVLHLGKPIVAQPLGLVPGSGFLRATLTAPFLAGGEEARIQFVQITLLDGVGHTFSNVHPITFVDSNH